jgi:hypothetical protein
MRAIIAVLSVAHAQALKGPIEDGQKRADQTRGDQ